MQDFYKEVDDNININRTFSINDIGDEDRLHRFYVIGEEIAIDNILEDSEFLLENTEKVMEKLERITSEDPDDTTPENSSAVENISLDLLGEGKTEE
jgi:hypothetical protein